MKDQVAIRLTDVSKDFLLPHERVDSIKGAFVNPFRSRKGLKKVERQHALKNISFEIKKGEFFGIVGRNGSGKSTLLKIIANIYKSTAGSVEVDGRLVPFIELGVGFNPDLTGRENVYLNGALLGFADHEVNDKYDSIVEFAELERFMDQKLKNYSSGMQVRLAFSVATILADSEILLIDEVLAVGDADFQRKCFNYFKLLKRAQKTVIFVTHDMEAVREYCDRAMLIDQSEIKAIGETRTIAQKYLQLFTDTQVHESADKEGIWGNGGVYSLNVSATVTKNEVIIEHAFRANREIQCIPGFRIRDSTGRDLVGTNSKLEGITVDMMRDGDTVKFVWKFNNILSDGSYTVDVAVLESDNITVAEWWNDAAEFSVTRQRHTPYPINVAVSVNQESVR